ncbi:hypothetical protein EU642_21995 [Salmonella enterica]|nr:hypothetical protein [Salmonella enterica]EAO0118526.1 hypothetical protein [Salmonella enterica]EAO3601630.1 hypothetical protein [Salmonella enterica]EAR6391524.1 hypothetical protein [Salmonella enterica]EAV1285288.1 hypothetical protein [Salmonella enterica]
MNKAHEMPDLVSFELMLKARPATEAGARFIYFEASNEGVDQQGERVLAKALKESKDHFLKFGNIDIDHYTMVGPRMGMTDYQSYEIGQPVDVAFRGEKTFVKARLYEGNTPLAARANEVWESMTALNPPAKWYPSVGGAILEKSDALDPKTGDKVTLIEKVRWTNVGLSRTPVNQHLPTATSHAVGTFAKSLNGFVLKALEASGATDSLALVGGGALRKQSLDTGKRAVSYHQFRDQLAGALLNKTLVDQSETGLCTWAASTFGMSPSEAADWVHRFLRSLKKQWRQS